MSAPETINYRSIPSNDTLKSWPVRGWPTNLLTSEEKMRMVYACENYQDPAIISLAFDAYVRPAELAQLMWKDVAVDEMGAVITLRGMTREPRDVQSCMAAKYLVEWWNHYPLDPRGENLVFLNSHNQPLTYHILNTRIRRIAERAGIQKEVTLHLLRRSGITDAIRRGVPAAVIKKQGWGKTSLLPQSLWEDS